VTVPGSKSITNRALVAALLADGRSSLDGVLFADDTEAMLEVIGRLGARVDIDRPAGRVQITGTGGALRPGPIELDCRMSGTTSRFTAPLAARGHGRYLITGAEQMRRRPMTTVTAALRRLGVRVEGDALPLTVHGGFTGGSIALAADVSSQFASGLLLAAPGLAHGLGVELQGTVVSRPYLDMTYRVMRSFGAQIDVSDGRHFAVPVGTAYRATNYRIEPDASAASYFFAAAAVTGGTVRVDGLGDGLLQGDVRFVDVLERMGATVVRTEDTVTVTGPDRLMGVDVDMADISDTAQTLAAIAPFASTPTQVRGIGFIRAKETDRIRAVVTELTRLGIDARENPDGFTIPPGRPRPGTVQTYDDHRMAMSFAVMGLVTPGISIADAGCVAKTFPGFWRVLDTLR